MQDTIDPFAEFLVTIQGLWVNAIAFLTGVMQPGWRQKTGYYRYCVGCGCLGLTPQ